MSKATIERQKKETGSNDVAYKFIYAIVFSCFLFSGISGLIYEVVWTRMLTHIFGGTTLAVSTVLTAFLGGLALGSYLGGKYIDKIKKPLLTYGILELAIGAYGLIVPILFSQNFLTPIWQNVVLLFESVQFVSYIVRFLICVVLLAFPTILMGATLPLLSRYLTNVRSDMITFNVGSLYTINTLGAIIGTFTAGFIFLPSLGVMPSVYIAAGINLLLATLVILLAKVNQKVQVDTPEYENTSENLIEAISESQDDIPPDVVKLSMFAFAVSGFVALVFEVVWTRTLTLVLGSSTYAFTTMLTTFLAGITIGAAVMTKLQEKIERPVLWVGMIIAGIGVSGFLTGCFFNELPWLFLSRAQKLPDDPATSWFLLSVTRFVVSSAIMFIPTVLSGMVFPLVIRIYSARPDHIGESVGKLYSINTLGSIIGSFTTGFIFIPLFANVFGSGIHATMKFAIICSMAMGLYLIYKDISINSSMNEKQTKVYNSWVYIAAAVTLFANIFLMPAWDKSIMTTGVAIYHALSYKKMTKEQFFQSFTQGKSSEEIQFYREGLVTVVTITNATGSNTTLLKNNGKVDAGTPTDGDGPSNADMITQVLLGQLPLLLHKGNPESVLVVGLGSGCTTGSVMRWPSIKSVKVCEIEKAVIDGDKFFEAPENKSPLGANGSPLNPSRNPLAERVKAINTDGRNYLLTTKEKFDIIISQPADPWVQGASALFTKEFWELGSRHLKEGGLFCEWIQLYSITPEYLGVLVNTFKQSFGKYDKNGKKIADGYVYLFRPGLAGEILLIGSNEPFDIDINRIKERIQTKFFATGMAGSLEVITKDDLSRVSIHDASDIAAQLLLGNDQVDKFAEEQTKKIPRLKNLPLAQRINTDDNVIIEFEAPKKLHLFYAPIPENLEALGAATDGDVLKYLTNYGETDAEKAAFIANLSVEHTQKAIQTGNTLTQNVNLKIAKYLADKAVALSPSVLPYIASYQANSKYGNKIESDASYEKAKTAPKNTAEDWISFGRLQATEGNLGGAESAFRSATTFDPNNSQAWIRLGEVVFSRGQQAQSKPAIEESLTYFVKGRTLDTHDVEAWAGEGNAHFTLASGFMEYQNIPLAEQAYLNSFTADLNYWPSRLNYAKLLYGQGPVKYDVALENFYHLIRRLNQQNVEARYLVGKILQYKGELYNAYQYYQSAIQLGLNGQQLADATEQIKIVQQQIQSQGGNGGAMPPQQQQQQQQQAQPQPKPKADSAPTEEQSEAIKKLLNLQGEIMENPTN